MALTKHSERNLNVIENFILHLTHCSEGDEEGNEEQTYSANEMYQMAKSYIDEDHVDGEGSEEAILEIALGSELIIEECYGKDDENEERPLNVYANDVNGLIYEVDVLDNEVIGIYRLTKPQEVIEVEHRYEILSSVLAKYTKDDEVYLRDIFSHGTYIEKIN